MMARKTGFLANLNNFPPLIFRFQFNPDLMSDKKVYTYEPEPGGKWDFTKAGEASGLATLVGLYTDVEGFGPLINHTKQMRPKEGEQRTISIDFHLDASTDLPEESKNRYGGSIKPDLAVLRSFVYPGYKLTDLSKMLIATGLKDPPKDPPECNLVYGGIRLNCVMTDLNIKVTAFQDDGSPLRADISLTLKEQTFSTSPLTEYVERIFGSTRAMMGLSLDEIAVASPIGFLFE
jgi:hypothetical protein